MTANFGFPHRTPTAPDASEAPAVPPTASVLSALERVLLRFGGLVRQAARARGLFDGDVEEVVQDVRIRLWKTNASDENLEALSASYLKKVAMSAAVDLLRRRRRQNESIDELADGPAIPVALQVPSADRSDDVELARCFELALAHLARNRRLSVQLHLEGYSRDEIAALTGWTEAKVRNLIYRGLDELRVHLRRALGETA